MGTKRKVLIIDDEEAILKNMGDFLKAKGYEVCTDPDGNQGIELVKTQSPDLLILDLYLKEGPAGVQILRLTKMLKPDLKVVMFTGFGEDVEARNACVALGADDFLSKPTSLKTLTEVVDRLLKG